MKNLLFITWDGPQTSYMEGLFMPIFQEISKKKNIAFHVIQFTWASPEKIESIKKIGNEAGIKYTAFPIFKKPIASIGSLLTLFTSSKKIEKYIQDHHIDIVMPRSTFPAFLVNQIKNKNFQYIFDADGLPIEERVDFAGLKKTSIQYKWLKSIERKTLLEADAVLTRSQKSIEVHLKNIGEEYRKKFDVVLNGRNSNLYHLGLSERIYTRKELGLNEDDFLFVYAGSLGPQYGMTEMLEIFKKYAKKKPAKFLILTGNLEFAKEKTRDFGKEIIIKSVKSHQIPSYLNAADFAFGFRKPSPSMIGVAPIKLGEYLLAGLPLIASKGIGDTELILQNFESCYLYDHDLGMEKQITEILEFIEKTGVSNKEETKRKAMEYFSLEAAADSYSKAFYKMQKK